MKLNIKALIDFLDDKKDSQKGDANALIAMFGEELNAAVYKHFRKNKVEILDCSVLPGTNKGHRLDRWIVDKENKKLFQCEIKNWSASAINGKRLVYDATDEEVKKVVTHYWKHELKQSFSQTREQPNGVTKVLLKMKAPEGYENFKIESLLIYWMPVSPNQENLSPFSTITLNLFQLPIQTEIFRTSYFFCLAVSSPAMQNSGKHRLGSASSGSAHENLNRLAGLRKT